MQLGRQCWLGREGANGGASCRLGRVLTPRVDLCDGGDSVRLTAVLESQTHPQHTISKWVGGGADSQG